MMPALPSQIGAFSSPQLPMAIDYSAALALHQLALEDYELPKYLLAPEVSALLHYIPDLYRKALVPTLWNSGARVKGALALSRTDFLLQPPYPLVKLATLKKRSENGRPCACRESGSPSDTAFRTAVCQPAGDDGGHAEDTTGTKNKKTGRIEKARIWNITDRTVRAWLSEAVEAAAAYGVTFSVPVTPHTFRHSYTMHMFYAGIPLKVLQSLMGHKSISSTEVYRKVFYARCCCVT